MEELENKTDGFTLRYVRPKTKNGGSKDDKITTAEIEQCKDKIIKNLKETVVDEIRKSTEFKTKPDFCCRNCEFGFICGKEEDDE